MNTNSTQYQDRSKEIFEYTRWVRQRIHFHTRQMEKCKSNRICKSNCIFFYLGYFRFLAKSTQFKCIHSVPNDYKINSTSVFILSSSCACALFSYFFCWFFFICCVCVQSAVFCHLWATQWRPTQSTLTVKSTHLKTYNRLAHACVCAYANKLSL